MNSPQELALLIDQLRGLAARDFAGGAALATLVRTRGSTFRRVGTSMLVLGDGGVVCALSGGCPQRDIVRQAQEVMRSGQTRTVGYNSESGLDVLIETGCGGELDVLIEPLLRPRDIAWIDALADCLRRRRPAWMASVFDSAGGPPRRCVWDEDTLLFDGLDDPSLRQALRDDPQLPTLSGRPQLRESADDDHPQILLERLQPPMMLYIVGAGAGADALAPLALGLGWQVVVVDGNPDHLPPYAQAGLTTLAAAPGQLAEQAFDPFTAVVLMTHNLEQDLAYLRALARRPAAYLGVIGSRERVGQLTIHLGELPPRLHAPAGLDIGSETPAEIALAIAAEILAASRQRDGHKLRHSEGPIH